MRNSRTKLLLIPLRHELLHFLKIATKCGNTLLPRFLVSRRGRLWPVSVWPFWRNMFRVATEFEDIPLGNSHVFEELPSRVWKSLDLLAAQFGSKPTNRLVETDMRSEEHTSELQSRRDLVCRLLLEKK